MLKTTESKGNEMTKEQARWGISIYRKWKSTYFRRTNWKSESNS